MAGSSLTQFQVHKRVGKSSVMDTIFVRLLLPTLCTLLTICPTLSGSAAVAPSPEHVLSQSLSCYVCGEDSLTPFPGRPPAPACELDDAMPERQNCPASHPGCLTTYDGRTMVKTCGKFQYETCQVANHVLYCYCRGPLCNKQSVDEMRSELDSRAPHLVRNNDDDEDSDIGSGDSELTTFTTTTTTTSGIRTTLRAETDGDLFISGSETGLSVEHTATDAPSRGALIRPNTPIIFFIAIFLCSNWLLESTLQSIRDWTRDSVHSLFQPLVLLPFGIICVILGLRVPYLVSLVQCALVPILYPPLIVVGFVLAYVMFTYGAYKEIGLLFFFVIVLRCMK